MYHDGTCPPVSTLRGADRILRQDRDRCLRPGRVPLFEPLVPEPRRETYWAGAEYEIYYACDEHCPDPAILSPQDEIRRLAPEG